MTHSKLDIDDILAEHNEQYQQAYDTAKSLGQNVEYHTFDITDGTKQALLEAFEQSLNTIIGENLVPGDWPPTDENWVLANKMIIRNELRNEQRNEAIKVIRGEDNE